MVSNCAVLELDNTTVYRSLFIAHCYIYSLYKSLAANRSTFFSFNTSIHLSRLLGRITTFAIWLLANEYIYSINTPSSDKYPSTFAKAPGILGQLIPTTSVTFTAKWLSFKALYALSGSDTIPRKIPKSAFSAMHKEMCIRDRHWSD